MKFCFVGCIVIALLSQVASAQRGGAFGEESRYFPTSATSASATATTLPESTATTAEFVSSTECQYCVQWKGIDLNTGSDPWGSFPAVTAIKALQIARNLGADGFTMAYGRVFPKKAPFKGSFNSAAFSVALNFDVEISGIHFNAHDTTTGEVKSAETVERAKTLARDLGYDGFAYKTSTKQVFFKRSPFVASADPDMMSVSFGAMVLLQGFDVNPGIDPLGKVDAADIVDAWDKAAALGAFGVEYFNGASWPKTPSYYALQANTGNPVSLVFGSSALIKGVDLNYGSDPWGNYDATDMLECWSTAKQVNADGFVFVNNTCFPKKGPFVVTSAYPASLSVSFGSNGKATCRPGQQRCGSTTALQICSDDGRWETNKNCPTGLGCFDGVCTTCQAGNYRCYDDHSLQMCGSNGEWEMSSPCPGYCSGGSCVDCRLQDGRCTSAFTRQGCDVRSGFWAQPYSCPPKEKCADSTCQEFCFNEEKRCANSQTLQNCNVATGLWGSYTACEQGTTCIQGACRVCTPGAKMCVSSTSMKTCSADGSHWMWEKHCAPGKHCSTTSGSCEHCTPGETKCTADSNAVVTCTAQGTWMTGESCPNAHVCAYGKCMQPKQHPIKHQQKKAAYRLSNLFVHGDISAPYGYCDYPEGRTRGFTAGFRGFTSCNKGLLKVVQLYTNSLPSNPLAQYLPALEALDSDPNCAANSLAQLPNFCAIWASQESEWLFQNAQEELDRELFYKPSMDLAHQYRLKYAVSHAFLYDTVSRHPDAIETLLAEADANMKAPYLSTADEVAWLLKLIEIRENRLQSSQGPIEAYRYLVFSRQFALASPLVLYTPSYPELTIPSGWTGQRDGTL